MSNSQLDDLNQRKADEALADALGITVDELYELDYGDIESNESDDGLVYNYYIEIQKESSNAKILKKVIAINPNCKQYDDSITVDLGLNL